MHPLQLTRQKPAMPLPLGDGLLLAGRPGGGQHNESGQVIRFRAQAVPKPGAHARTAGDQSSGIHESMGRIVIDRFGFQRSNDTQIIRHIGEFREDC